MMKRRMINSTKKKHKRPRLDMGLAVSMIKKLMFSANAVPFLRKGRFEECEDKMYLEDVLTRVEDGGHQDIDEVFNDIYKVLKTERDGNEIQLDDQEKQVYDDGDAFIMAGMMIKTAKSLQKEIEDVLKVHEDGDEENNEDLILEDSKDVLLKLKRQFKAIPCNALHDEAVKMIFADSEGREKIMEDLSKMEDFYKPKFDVVKLDEDSSVYKKVSTYFKKSVESREENENCDIENIFKINNKCLTDIYHNAIEEIETRLGGKSRKEILFHGTSDKAIASIVKNNFDVEVSPNDIGELRPKRAKYGKGIYLTSSSATSLLYGNVIIVCKVILGNCEIINIDKVSDFNRDIPAEYDSRKVTYSYEKHARVCVVKEPQNVLPYCVITLKNKELSAGRRRSANVISEKGRLSAKLGRCLY